MMLGSSVVAWIMAVNRSVKSKYKVQLRVREIMFVEYIKNGCQTYCNWSNQFFRIRCTSRLNAGSRIIENNLRGYVLYS